MNPLPHHQKKALKMIARLVSLLLFLSYGIALAPSATFAASDDKDLFSVDDYLKYKRIIDLRLSSDGEMIAYLVQAHSLEENKTIRTVYVSGTQPGDKARRIEAIQDARRFAWIPGTKELAFLSNAEGNNQVYAHDFKSKKRSALTDIPSRVTKFKFSSDGRALAFLTQAEADIDRDAAWDTFKQKNSFYDLVHEGESGVLVDTETIGFLHYIDPNLHNVIDRPQTRLWLKIEQSEAQSIAMPGEPKEFHWSPDATRMSVIYVDQRIPRKRHFGQYTSIGIVTLPDRTFRSFFDAQAPETDDLKSGRWYRRGEWGSDGRLLHVRRLSQQNAFITDAEWTVIDFRSTPTLLGGLNWREIENSKEDVIHSVENKELTIARTMSGQRGLFKVTDKVSDHEIMSDLDGTLHHFSFSADSRVVAFVKEDLVNPQEVYVLREGAEPFRLTHLNAVIAAKRMPRMRDITWQSRDGTMVHGWLIEPSTRSDDDRKPWPLITYVHGGPSSPYRNEFAYCFYGTNAPSGRWPYPFLAYANHGMAVFMPNYRGTKTYGDEFGNPKTIDGEPVDDVVSGIEHLIDQRIADPAHLAISGHSHGAFLGPLVMTRYRQFKAASFAEGFPEFFGLYQLSPSASNRGIHDVLIGNGKSLYEDPQRYIEISSPLYFQGLETAVFAEAGQQSLALNMMAIPKAARFAGMPEEFIVYPKTGHNIVVPRLKEESANRNLDWFRFWLLGEEDGDPTKADQYDRWREMRDQQKSKRKTSESTARNLADGNPK